MSSYNPEKHHRKSIRLKGYDYSQAGYYFITININDIRCMLAVWSNGKLQITPAGKTAKKYWLEIPEHYPHVKIDEYVIMPDHMHGILYICGNAPGCKGAQLINQSQPCKGVQLNAPTVNPNNNPNPHFANLSPASGSLSVIIRNYKSTVKRWCNKNHCLQFKWQRGYYDRVIRDDKELNRIRDYIKNNPQALQCEFPALGVR